MSKTMRQQKWTAYTESREALGCAGRGSPMTFNNFKVRWNLNISPSFQLQALQQFVIIKFRKSRAKKSGLWKGEILVQLFAATARLWMQMEGWCEQVQQALDCPTWYIEVVTHPANKISCGGFTTPLFPSPGDSWFWLQNRQWQVGHPWDSYLELLHSSFLKERVWKKGKESNMNTHSSFISSFLSTISLRFHFFFFYYSFLIYGIFHMLSGLLFS